MASKRRIRRSACSRKKRHETAAQAKREMNRLIRVRIVGDTPLHIYQCPWCSGWHVGHRPAIKGNHEKGNHND